MFYESETIYLGRIFVDLAEEKAIQVQHKYYREMLAKHNLDHQDRLKVATEEGYQLEDVLDMARDADLFLPISFTSHRPQGHLIIKLKRGVFRLLRPLLKICLGRQQCFNYHTIALAHQVVDLNKRIVVLEEALHKQSLKTSQE